MPKGVYNRNKKVDSSNQPSKNQRIGITLNGRTEIKVMTLTGTMLGTVIVSPEGINVFTPNAKSVNDSALIPYAKAALFFNALSTDH